MNKMLDDFVTSHAPKATLIDELDIIDTAPFYKTLHQDIEAIPDFTIFWRAWFVVLAFSMCIAAVFVYVIFSTQPYQRPKTNSAGITSNTNIELHKSEDRIPMGIVGGYLPPELINK
jgi:hypothetical protein